MFINQLASAPRGCSPTDYFTVECYKEASADRGFFNSVSHTIIVTICDFSIESGGSWDKARGLAGSPAKP